MIKKITNRKEYTVGEYLPEKLTKKLIEDIFDNPDYEYRTKNNFLQCVATIYFHQVTQAIGLNNYVPLGRGYWKKIYGGNYHETVLKPLLHDFHIIESKKIGSPTFPDKTAHKAKGIPKGDVYIRYRINPELLNDKYVFIPYIQKGEILTAMERILLGKEKFLIPDIPDLNFRVSIDTVKANKWIEENADSICHDFLKQDYVKTLPDGLWIECHEYLDKGSYNVRYKSVRSAKFIAAHRNQDFFYFNNTFYIANQEEFLQQRIPALIYYYKHQISQILTQPLEEKQNPITLRIYSHLTNFPSRILQFIHINNQTVVQYDLRTSQFLIFANILNVYIKHGEEHLLSLFKQGRNITYLKRLVKILKLHHEQLPKTAVDISDNNSGVHSLSDVTKFIRDIFFSDFYAVVQRELGLQERLLAKHVLFKLLFKKTNRPDELLRRLSLKYPIVMNIIAEFKKQEVKPTANKKKIPRKDNDERESNFSVFLQCIEGEIFVDNILKQLRVEGIACFTRHDSIVVASGYKEKAEEIAKSVFRHFGFKYNSKIEEMFWEEIDYEELEGSTYMQWLTDEDILNNDYIVEENEQESVDELTENDINMDEAHVETLERLRDIGLQENYFEYVNVEFLVEISDLPFLSKKQRDLLAEDIMNINYGMSFFQPETEELLRWIVQYEI